MASTATAEVEIPLRIVLRRPPVGVRFALQRGDTHAGKVAALEAIQDADGVGDLSFECTVRVRRQPDGSLRFLGPFVHGPTTARFVYITVGKRASQPMSPWDRRAKIPLAGITPEMVAAVSADSGVVLQATIEGALPDGSPTCATRPFVAGGEWKEVARTG